MNPTTEVQTLETLVTAMQTQIAHLTRTLGTWMHADVHTLAEVEQQVVRLLKDVGTTVLSGLCALTAPAVPEPTMPCPCGATARYQRQRPAHLTTLLGPIRLVRAYYLCATCGHGQHPLDTQLAVCAGSRSAALDELLALLGATQDSFAQAALVLERLSLVHISPNSVRDATEQLGAVLLAQQTPPEPATDVPSRAAQAAAVCPQRLYIAMDGVLAHLHQRNWSEIKVGCCFQTHARPSRRHPERQEIRAENISYITTLKEARDFGWLLWEEAVRRGVLGADEVVVLGDGAQWIWNLAETHFPQATQIVDWYHASQYVWNAAAALWRADGAQRSAWVQARLEELWEGKVDVVIADLEQQEEHEAVMAALSYYRNQGSRMQYGQYRARGLQIGSGSIESACKQLVTARLKQAGMIWNADGAEAVALVRAWLKSGRWDEAIALRPVRQRQYRRRRGQMVAEAEGGATRTVERESPRTGTPTTQERAGGGLPSEMIARVRAELAQERATHPWRRAWSVRQQRAQAEQVREERPALAA